MTFVAYMLSTYFYLKNVLFVIGFLDSNDSWEVCLNKRSVKHGNFDINVERRMKVKAWKGKRHIKMLIQ